MTSGRRSRQCLSRPVCLQAGTGATDPGAGPLAAQTHQPAVASTRSTGERVSNAVPRPTGPIMSGALPGPARSGQAGPVRLRRPLPPRHTPRCRETPVLRTDDLEYPLPPDRIATRPAEPRDAARLMVIRRDRPDHPEHALIRDLPDLLRPSDRLVLNTTRVLPARFRGVREDTGGRVEGLYLGEASDGPVPAWRAMIKARRHRPGAIVRLAARDSSAPSPYALRMLEPLDDPPGAWLAQPLGPEGPPPTPDVLGAVGLPPLPPYILAARRAKRGPETEPEDDTRYQTVYAGAEASGSVAAPTAGLHFTPELLGRLASRGVSRTDVVLHVGAGTFKPVETDLVESHPMHAEWCSMSPEAVGAVVATRRAGGRVVAVGTTSVRTLESYAPLADPPPNLATRLLITPGRPFRWTDGLLTNFHLPRSTLMALVAAMLQHPDEPPDGAGVPPGVTRLKAAYADAVTRGYRFYSFGDAMLIV
jgi:S-adenosylmethionine:tRNA ribosyltransferase-isomerase